MITRLGQLQITHGEQASACAAQSTSAHGILVADPEIADPSAGPSLLAEARITLDQAAIDQADATGPVTILVRAGVHRLRRSLTIGAAGGSLILRPCPGEVAIVEGPADAPALVVHGGRRVTVAGLVFAGPSPVQIVLAGASDCAVVDNSFLRPATALVLDGARNNRVVGNVVRAAGASGIELKDGSDGNIVSDNTVMGTGARETTGGGIFLHGASDNRIAHNRIADTAGFGIGILNWDDSTINRGNVVEFNRLERTVQHSEDSGAIYLLGRSGLDTGAVVAGNVVDTFGAPGRHNVGIYLDDSTNGAVVIGNLLRGVGSDAIQIHGGQDNRLEGNMIDLGADQPSAVLFQAAPLDTNPANRQTGNVVTRNVVLSSSPSPRPFVSYDGGTPEIAGNLYVVPPGASIVTEAAAADQAPSLAVSADPAPHTLSGYAALGAHGGIGFRPVDWSAAGPRPRREAQ